MLGLNPAALPRKQDEPQTNLTASKYDQDKVWKALVAEAAALGGTTPTVNQVISDMEDLLGPTMTSCDRSPQWIIHILFDRSVTPSGGLLYRATMSDGALESRKELIEAMGYIVEDGKIYCAEDGSPAGKAYKFLKEWSDDSLTRGELDEPIKISATRNGNPFFMDDAMIAFGVLWYKGGWKESVSRLVRGFEGRGIAKIVAVSVDLKR